MEFELAYYYITVQYFSHYVIRSSFYIKVRGAYDKFPDFFSYGHLKFTMLLQYILWDNWPIFMISASNEQLQKQLEYTLLKPDCHSWWISKMQSDSLKERYAIKFCFKLVKNATETYGMLQNTFGASCMNRASVFEMQKILKEGREFMRDDERCKEVHQSWLASIHTKKMLLSLCCSANICIYTVFHRQTVSLYHNSSVWIDTKGAWSWDRNSPNFVSYRSANKRTSSAREL